MKILVIAPHPDDEVLGCGGTIKKYSASGHEVYLLIVTKAYAPDWTEEYIKNKERETASANNALGIKETFFLDLPTVKLDTLSQKQINDAIAGYVEKIRPEAVYIPFIGDINQDHQLIAEASLVSVRPKPWSSVERVLAYEVLSETEWSIGRVPFTPHCWEDISGFIEDKKKAMACYQSELKQFPHPRSLEGIEILAKKRGMEVGMSYAEAFMVFRQIQ